jgi:hypothetical protein
MAQEWDGKTDRRVKTEHRTDLEERRAKGDRQQADRLVGKWVAGRMGMSKREMEIYTQSIIDAGMADPRGRAGFDRILKTMGTVDINVEELRTRYFLALSGVS